MADPEGGGRMRLKTLDRYVLRQFLQIFGVCALGVPFVFIVIDLTDSLDNFLAGGVGGGAVFVHYVYQFPYQSLLSFPIAALLAAVFTIHRMTGHFEIAAAKAGGISFHRLTAPLLLAGLVLSVVALGMTEIVPETNRRSEAALHRGGTAFDGIRRSFVYRAKLGRVYEIGELEANRGRINGMQIEREGTGYAYPTYAVTAESTRWDSAGGRWALEDGRLRLFPERGVTYTFKFHELHQRAFTETPTELLADPKDPDDMNYGELGRFIDAIERSGGDARKLIVQRMLKIAFPFTCFIIVLFGVPLAHSTRRGGTTMAIGVALMTTLLFLILIRIAQALGAGGTLPPEAAAWLPNGLFFVAGLVLMVRVRT